MNTEEGILNTRCLISLCIIGLFLHANVLAPPLPPPPDIGMLADVGFADIQDQVLNLIQTESGDFEDCIALKVVNTFRNLVILAQIHPSPDVAICDNWFVKLNEPGEKQPYESFRTSNIVQNAHLPGAFGDLELCVKATEVNIGFQSYVKAGSTVRVAEVTLTMMPDF